MSARGLATTLLSSPETVLSPAEMMAQQGSRPNCARALMGTSSRTAAASAISPIFPARPRGYHFGSSNLGIRSFLSVPAQEVKKVVAERVNRLRGVLAQSVGVRQAGRFLAQLSGQHL